MNAQIQQSEKYLVPGIEPDSSTGRVIVQPFEQSVNILFKEVSRVTCYTQQGK